MDPPRFIHEWLPWIDIAAMLFQKAGTELLDLTAAVCTAVGIYNKNQKWTLIQRLTLTISNELHMNVCGGTQCRT